MVICTIKLERRFGRRNSNLTEGDICVENLKEVWDSPAHIWGADCSRQREQGMQTSELGASWPYLTSGMEVSMAGAGRWGESRRRWNQKGDHVAAYLLKDLGFAFRETEAAEVWSRAVTCPDFHLNKVTLVAALKIDWRKARE